MSSNANDTQELNPGVVPFNERQSLLNDGARQSRVLVQVVYLYETRIPNSMRCFYATGLPTVRQQSCKGGVNVTIECFVSDKDIKARLVERS